MKPKGHKRGCKCAICSRYRTKYYKPQTPEKRALTKLNRALKNLNSDITRFEDLLKLREHLLAQDRNLSTGIILCSIGVGLSLVGVILSTIATPLLICTTCLFITGMATIALLSTKADVEHEIKVNQELLEQTAEFVLESESKVSQLPEKGH